MDNSRNVATHDHLSFISAIDTACINSAMSAANIESWLTSGRGPYLALFIGDVDRGIVGFYPNFSTLFRLTSRLVEMKTHQDLCNKIDKWIIPQRMGVSKEQDIARMSEGIAMFSSYYYALNNTGIVTIRK